jgi:two-component system chemotaxis response regulator CheY
MIGFARLQDGPVYARHHRFTSTDSHRAIHIKRFIWSMGAERLHREATALQGPTMPGRLHSSLRVSHDGERRALQLLIVDDDASQRRLISIAATQAGHAVTVAPSCAEALRQLRDQTFDCVTLDLMLGDGDGVQVLQAIAEAKFAGSVIVISGMDAAHRSAARSYARSLGIDLQSLPKPIDLAALRICLANLRQAAMGLPVVHIWGGVAANGVAGRHRS